jgi:hypothetical protein
VIILHLFLIFFGGCNQPENLQNADFVSSYWDDPLVRILQQNPTSHGLNTSSVGAACTNFDEFGDG